MGIMWRPLCFNMKHNINTIDACLRLHNFIVDYRESYLDEGTNQAVDRDIFDEDCRRFMARQANVGRVGVDGGELDARRHADVSINPEEHTLWEIAVAPHYCWYHLPSFLMME